MGKYSSLFISLTLMTSAAHAQPQSPFVPPVHVSYGKPTISILEDQKKDEEEEKTYSAHSNAPLFSPLVWAQVGVGFNQIRYRQSIPDFLRLGFDDKQVLTTRLNVGAWLHYNWGVKGEYHNVPLSPRDSETLQLIGTDFHIEKLGGEVLWRAHPAFVQQRWDCFLKLGMHQFDFPLLVPASSAILSFQHSSVRSISMGFEVHKKIAEQWRLESGARYFQPLTSQGDQGADLVLSPHFSTDASLGLLYRTLDYTSIGAYYVVEWYDYSYRYTGGPYNIAMNGYQNIFLSTFEIRMGVEF